MESGLVRTPSGPTGCIGMSVETKTEPDGSSTETEVTVEKVCHSNLLSYKVIFILNIHGRS